MSRILLTGSKGFIGRRLAHELLQAGNDVLGVDPAACPDYTPPCTTIREITEDDILKWHPEKIVLCGAIKGLDACRKSAESFEKNISSLLPYLRYALSFPGTQILFVSSDMVFGGMAEGAPYAENCAVKACNAYGAMKIAGEQLVSLSPKHAIVRTALVYGELDDEESLRFVDELKEEELSNQTLFYSWLAYQIRTRGRVSLADNVYSTPTWVMDLVRDIRTILKRDLVGVFHSCGAKRYSRLEMGRNVLSPLGYEDCIDFFSAQTGLRPLDVSMCSSKTRKVLDGTHVSPEEVMLPMVREEIGL